MSRANCGPDHPWRQYRRRHGLQPPTTREIAVAEVMAECDCGGPGCRHRKATADEIAARLDMKPANVRNIMVQIRRRLGVQAR